VETIIYVVYDHPDDYPHSFVVRLCKLHGDGKWEMDLDPLIVSPTLHGARSVIPADMKQRPSELPVGAARIVELWSKQLEDTSETPTQRIPAPVERHKPVKKPRFKRKR